MVSDAGIYLYCYNRLFAIKQLYKNGFSYNLNPDQYQFIAEMFTGLNIPFKNEQTEEGCVVDCLDVFDSVGGFYNLLMVR